MKYRQNTQGGNLNEEIKILKNQVLHLSSISHIRNENKNTEGNNTHQTFKDELRGVAHLRSKHIFYSPFAPQIILVKIC